MMNIELKLLYANTISCFLPMDQGVTRAFKVNHNKKLMRSLGTKMDKVKSVHELAMSMMIADADSMI